MAVYALKAIRDLNLPIDRRIRVLFGSDEECGSSCVKYYVENGYEMPTIGFTPDAQFPAIFCEKGTSNFLAGTKIYNKGEIDVEYFGGGVAANVVPPVCKLMWDENVLAFLRFETVCYAARFLVMRLQAHMGLWVENTEGHM